MQPENLNTMLGHKTSMHLPCTEVHHIPPPLAGTHGRHFQQRLFQHVLKIQINFKKMCSFWWLHSASPFSSKCFLLVFKTAKPLAHSPTHPIPPSPPKTCLPCPTNPPSIIHINRFLQCLPPSHVGERTTVSTKEEEGARVAERKDEGGTRVNNNGSTSDSQH